MAETILFALAEWSIRATILAGVVGALLWAVRIKNAHIKLAAAAFDLRRLGQQRLDRGIDLIRPPAGPALSSCVRSKRLNSRRGRRPR